MLALTTAITANNIRRVQDELRDNLAQIMAKAADVSDEQSRWSPGKGEWSLVDVIAHLRSSADLNHFRIYAMLAVDHPLLPAIHPRLEWQRIVPYARVSLAQSLDAYRLQREELLLVLGELDESGWRRSGSWGNHTYSVYLVARSMALHEQEHFEQIDNLAAPRQ